MGIFKKHTWFGKAEKAIKKVVKTGLNIIGAVGSAIPVVGGVISGVAGGLASLIPEDKQKKMLEAASKVGSIDLSEIRKTLQELNPTMSAAEVETYAAEVAGGMKTMLPTANYVDTGADKGFKGFWSKYKIWIICGGVALVAILFFAFSGKKGGRRR